MVQRKLFPWVLIQHCLIAAPPSYAEHAFGKVNVRDEGDDQYTRGDLAWAPTYIYYTWDQSRGQPGGQTAASSTGYVSQGSVPPPGGQQYNPNIAPVHNNGSHITPMPVPQV